MALVLELQRRTTRHVRPPKHVVFNGEIQSKEQALGTYGRLLLETRNSRPRIYRNITTNALAILQTLNQILHLVENRMKLNLLIQSLNFHGYKFNNFNHVIVFDMKLHMTICIAV